MAINRISGNILQDDLRRGANLAIQGNLIYFDVSNDRVGILTSAPQEDFDVDGNLRVGNVTVFEAGNIDAGNVWINRLEDPVANTDAATKRYVDNASSNVNVTISDGSNTQQVFNGSTITFLAVSDETTVVVSSPDTVTIGLPADVVIANSLSVPGNITGGNVISNAAIVTQTVLASGNITGNNVTANNTVSTVSVLASGNVTANNVASNNSISAITVTASGNIAGNNISSNNDIATVTVSASGNITGNNVTSNNSVLAVTVTATGNITGNNLVSNNDVITATVTASGNITGNNLTSNNNIVTATVLASANITGNNITSNNLISTVTLDAAGNITANNIIANNEITVTSIVVSGNVTANNLVSNNDVTTASVTASGNISGNNLTSNNDVTTATVSASGNITGNNLISNNDVTTVTVTASGNVTSNNLISNNDVTTATVTASGNVTGNNLISNNDVTTATVTALGNITGVTFLGNVEGSYADFTGNVTASNFIGNIQGNIDAGGANTQVQFNDGDILAGSAGFTFDKTSNLVTVSGNVAAANAVISDTVTTANLTASNVIRANGGNIQSSASQIDIFTAGPANQDIYLGQANALGLTIQTPITTVTSPTAILLEGPVYVGSGTQAELYTDKTTAKIFSDAGMLTGNLFTFANTITIGNTVGNTTVRHNLLVAANITANNVTSNNDIATVTVTASGNIVLAGTVIGNRILGNSDLLISSQSNQNITLDPGLGLVDIDTTSGLVIPVGNTAQRPGTAVTGTIRYNTEIQRVELYDGTEWDEVLSDVSGQIITPSGATAVFTLDRATTNVAALVAINGVVQLPGVAYSVSGNIITFAETPLSTDIIDIRFL